MVARRSMIGGSQVASWRCYPRVHRDPTEIERMAGVGGQTGERAKLSMDHEVVFSSVQNDEMALADGAAKLRDLPAEAEQRRVQKHNLTKTSWSYGKNGPSAKYAVSARMPDVRGDHRRAPIYDNSVQPRPYLWDYDRKSQNTTIMQECMDGGLEARGENVGEGTCAVDPQALKAQLTRTTCKFGDGRWYGFNKRATRSHEGADLGANRAQAASKGPVGSGSAIAQTLFPSEDRTWKTSSYETMRPDLYLDRQLMRSRQAGGRREKKEDDALRIGMPTCFSPYKGGRSPVQ